VVQHKKLAYLDTGTSNITKYRLHTYKERPNPTDGKDFAVQTLYSNLRQGTKATYFLLLSNTLMIYRAIASWAEY
jgi:hypothetical protein